MNPAIRPLSYLIISALGMRCVTPQQRVSLVSPNLSISCAYVEKSRRFDETEAECILTNRALTPERIMFKQVSLEDPHAEIQPIDAARIKGADPKGDVVLILGTILIVGGIIALLTKSKVHSIQIPLIIPSEAIPAFEKPTKSPPTQQKTVITDTFEIPASRSVRLVFLARHGIEKPRFLALRLGDNLIKVPIQTPVGWSRKRSDF